MNTFTKLNPFCYGVIQKRNQVIGKVNVASKVLSILRQTQTANYYIYQIFLLNVFFAVRSMLLKYIIRRNVSNLFASIPKSSFSNF